MKVKSLINSIFLAVGLSIVFGPVRVIADELTLVADDWCPYNCTPGSSNEGFMIDVAKAIFEKAGHKVTYKNMPWSRAVVSGRNGEVTGIIGAYKEDAPDFIFPENFVTKSGQEFFVAANSDWKFENMDSLKTVSLGVIQDYSYGKVLDAYIQANKKNSSRIQSSGGDMALETNVKKLLAGRISAVVEDQSVMQYLLGQLNMTDKVKYVGGLPKESVYIAFSPKNPKSKEYAELFSKGMEEITKNGQLAAIFGKYGIKL